MTEKTLTADERLAIQVYTDRHIGRYAAIFGIANFLVVVAAIWTMYGMVGRELEGAVAEVARQATDAADSRVNDYISTLRVETDRVTRNASDRVDKAIEDVSKAIEGISFLLGQLEDTKQRARQMEAEFANLEKSFIVLGSKDQINNAARLIEAVGDSSTLEANLVKIGLRLDKHASGINWLNNRVRGVDGGSLRIVMGRTSPADTPWQDYTSSNGVFVRVDTSAAGFTTTPIYFTSLGGTSSHWVVSGTTSIYEPTPTSFSIYVTAEPYAKATDLARSQDWHVNWIAIGR